jgi:hypothetical protein
MREIIGYGLWTYDETLRQAGESYLDGCMVHKTKKEALAYLRKWRKSSNAPKKKKVKIIRIVVEEEV